MHYFNFKPNAWKDMGYFPVVIYIYIYNILKFINKIIKSIFNKFIENK